MSGHAPASGFSADRRTPETLDLHGTLGFASAGKAWPELQGALAAEPGLTTLDLSGITHVDSAGLACLLAVLGEASAQGRGLRLIGAPTAMHTLAQVCGVDGLLAASA